MNKHNLKLIMELIFIFILPLLFICFTSKIQVEREFTYDNEGNYETSEDTKQLSFDNSIIKYIKNPNYINYLNLNQVNYNGNAETNSNWDYFNGSIEILPNGIKYTSNNTDNKILGYSYNNSTRKILNHKYYIKIMYNSNYDFSIQNIMRITLSKDDTIFEGIYSATDNTYLNIMDYFYNYDNTINDWELIINYYELIDLTNMFGNGYEPTTINELKSYINLDNYIPYGNEIIEIYDNNIISENYRINYSIWGNIKQLLINNLELNDNVLLDIVLCYTILWFIMFLIWHLLYGFLELLFHVIPSRWKEGSLR